MEKLSETNWDRSRPERLWWYKDEDDDKIGPSPGSHIHHWIEAGHIDENTMISCDETHWACFKDIKDQVKTAIDDEDDDDNDKGEEGEEELEKEEEKEVVEAVEDKENKKNPTKRSSIVTIESEDGSGQYFYDDPDLGGTGKTAWDLKDLDKNKDADSSKTTPTSTAVEETNPLPARRASSNVGQDRHLPPKRKIKSGDKDQQAPATKSESKTTLPNEKGTEKNKMSTGRRRSELNLKEQAKGRRRSVFLKSEIARIVELDKDNLKQDKLYMKQLDISTEEKELRKEWIIPTRICDQEGNQPTKITFPTSIKMTSPDGKTILVSEHANGTKKTQLQDVKVYEYTDGVKIQVNADGSIIRRDPDGVVTQKTPQGVEIWQNKEGYRKQVNKDESILLVHPNGHRLTIHKTGLYLMSFGENGSQPIGTKIQYNANGSKLIQLPKGGPMIQWMAKGVVMVTTSNRKTQKMEDGAIIVQNISEGWVCQLNKDGTEIVKLNDGSRYEKKPDGSTLERDSNNTVTQTLEDGIIIRVFEDGKKEQYSVNGTKLTMHTNGVLVQEETDGTIVEKRPDGTMKQTNPDGTIIEQ